MTLAERLLDDAAGDAAKASAEASRLLAYLRSVDGGTDGVRRQRARRIVNLERAIADLEPTRKALA